MTFVVVVTMSAAPTLPQVAPEGLPASRHGDVVPDPEDEDYVMDTVAKFPKNTAEGQDVTTKLLENRFRGDSEEFTRKWYDHVFLEAGAGVYKIVPPTEDAEFAPMTAFHLGIGKVLGRYHTLRFSAEGAVGYQKSIEHPLWKVAGRLDYLFNMTAHAKGYDPARPFEIQFLIGGGVQRTEITGKESRITPEGHLGLQVKLLTGGYGNLTIEPYVSLTADKVDYSATNWKHYDILYGVNVNLMHFLRNDLSPRQKKEMARKLPWFLQMSMGAVACDGDGCELPLSDSMGEEMSLSVGKWLSPAVGLRGTFSTSSTKYERSSTEADLASFTPSYSQFHSATNTTFRLEAMINPFGFVRNYNWERKWGVHLFGGLGVTRTVRDDEDVTRRLWVTALMYSGGIHLYAKVRPGVNIFLEPRFQKVVYRVPYVNVYRGRICEDNYYSLSMGVSLNLSPAPASAPAPLCPADISPKRGEILRVASTSTAKDSLPFGGGLGRGAFPLTVGIAGMMPFAQYQGKCFEGDKGMDYGGKFFAQWHFNRVSSARLNVEYVRLETAEMCDFHDVTWQGTDEVRRERTGLFSFANDIIIATAAYAVNIPELLSSAGKTTGGSRLDAEVFAGIGGALYVAAKPELYSAERLLDGHSASLISLPEKRATFAIDLGVKLAYALTRHVGIYVEPQMYFTGKMQLPGRTLTGVGKLNSIALGVQYKL